MYDEENIIKAMRTKAGAKAAYRVLSNIHTNFRGVQPHNIVYVGDLTRKSIEGLFGTLSPVDKSAGTPSPAPDLDEEADEDRPSTMYEFEQDGEDMWGVYPMNPKDKHFKYKTRAGAQKKSEEVHGHYKLDEAPD